MEGKPTKKDVIRGKRREREEMKRKKTSLTPRNTTY